MAVSLPAAETIGAHGEGVLLGIFWLLFPATLFVLVTKRKNVGSMPMDVALLTGTILLGILTTTHWVCDVMRVFEAFIVREGKPKAALISFAAYADWRSVLRMSCFCFQMHILDVLLILRVYIVWNRNIWVTLPVFVTWLCGFVASIGFVHGLATAPAGMNLFHSTTMTWITAAFVSDLAVNLLAVGLIAYKILSRSSNVHRIGGPSLWSVVQVLVESSALTCVVMTMALVAHLLGSPLNLTFTAICSPVTGIASCLIVLRVGLKRARFSIHGFDTEGGDTGNSSTLAHGSNIMPMQVRIHHDASYMVDDASLHGLEDKAVIGAGTK